MVRRGDHEAAAPAELYSALIGSVEPVSDQSGMFLAPRPLNAALLPLRGRVLVVEDQALNLEVAAGMLSALALEVDVAVNGRQALEKLAAGQYDAVLMDCQMPVMDGFSATAEWRRRESEGKRVPIIALTADTTSAGRLACTEAGMDDYLGKPFSRVTLHAVLARWLAPAEHERPSVARKTR